MDADAEYVERCRSIARLMGLYGLLEDEPARLRTLLKQATATFPDASLADIEAAFEKHITAQNLTDRFERMLFKDAVRPTTIDEIERFVMGRGRALSERIARGIRFDGMEQRIHDGEERLRALREDDPDLAGIIPDFAEANVLISEVASQWIGANGYLMAAVYNAMSASGGTAAIAFSPETVLDDERNANHIGAALCAVIFDGVTDREIASYLAFEASDTGRRFFWSIRQAVNENHPLEDMAAELMKLGK